MMSRNQRLSFLGMAAVIAVVAIIVLTAGGGSDEAEQDSADNAAATVTATATPSADGDQAESTPTPTPTPTPKPQPPLLQAGNVAKLRFKEGETVRFRVRNDAPDHVHIHGYDIMKDIEPGKTANVSFKATITGIFEIEFEDSAQEIAELRVDPK
jgi:FtsP/CotA-like multicopper oxidase with cupredoxin domain